MKRVLRNPLKSALHEKTDNPKKRLQENIDNLQDQFNKLIEKMTLAKITLEQLEQGADAVDVNFHTDETEEYAGY
jgi:hypothetical protein